jgi:hypothetical protein
MPVLPGLDEETKLDVQPSFTGIGKVVGKSDPYARFARPRNPIEVTRTPVVLAHNEDMLPRTQSDANARFRHTPNPTSPFVDSAEVMLRQGRKLNSSVEQSFRVSEQNNGPDSSVPIRKMFSGQASHTETAPTKQNVGKRTIDHKKTTIEPAGGSPYPRPAVFLFTKPEVTDPLALRPLTPEQARKEAAKQNAPTSPFCFKVHQKYVLRDSDPLNKKLETPVSPPHYIRTPWAPAP